MYGHPSFNNPLFYSNITQPTQVINKIIDPRTKPITRTKHKKSKVGCPQCKKRKVKCDETLPACTKCVNRRVRCGYLDYSQKEIDLVKLAQWEADGSNPATNPVTNQSGSTTEKENNDSLSPDKLSSQESSSFQTPDSLHSPNSLQYQSYNGIGQTSISPRSFTSQGLTTNSSKILQYCEQGEFKLRYIPHKPIPAALDISKYPSYFNETLSTFAIRAFIKDSCLEKLVSATVDMMGFNGALLMGYGPLILKHPELEVYFLKSRGICMNIILKNLSNVNDSNAVGLRNLAVHLDTSSVFLRDGISYKQHFKLSTGPTTIIRKVYENPSKFPKSFPIIKSYADAVLYTNKYVWVPQYNTNVLAEFYQVVREFGEKYIKNNDNKVLTKQYDSMIEFTEFCLDLLENQKSSDLVIRYPIDKLYELVQRWFAILPSECFVLDNTRMTGAEKVFYVFWPTLLTFLESFIVSCRYIFTFFLDGFFLTYPFQREHIDSTLNETKDDDLKWFFNYSCRIISFFSRRMDIVIRNTVFNEPIPIFLELKDRLKARPLEINERYITSFKDTVIKKIHYPTESTRLKAFKNPIDLIAYYKSFEPGSNKETPEDDIDLSEYLRDLDANDHENEVDLLNNINLKTSLLNNDFDPRFTDPVFNEKVVFQDATLEYFDRYIEDRRLIVQMINDEVVTGEERESKLSDCESEAEDEENINDTNDDEQLDTNDPERYK